LNGLGEETRDDVRSASGRESDDNADHLVQGLRAGGERPANCYYSRASKKRDELAPPHDRFLRIYL
jgi:hypothetical protein